MTLAIKLQLNCYLWPDISLCYLGDECVVGDVQRSRHRGGGSRRTLGFCSIIPCAQGTCKRFIDVGQGGVKVSRSRCINAL